MHIYINNTIIDLDDISTVKNIIDSSGDRETHFLNVTTKSGNIVPISFGYNWQSKLDTLDKFSKYLNCEKWYVE